MVGTRDYLIGNWTLRGPVSSSSSLIVVAVILTGSPFVTLDPEERDRVDWTGMFDVDSPNFLRRVHYCIPSVINYYTIFITRSLPRRKGPPCVR